jgi:Glyoxalase-like domain
VALATVNAAAAAPPRLQFDHVWIMVSANAPERAPLERAGFQIAKEINRHDGQGTASITVEFENSYLELIWPDSTVNVAPGLERAAEKFRQRMLWRSSGWCPIGVGFRRIPPSNDAFPFPTWPWTAEWMPKGSAMVMLTPRDDTRSPALFVEPPALTNSAEQAARGSLYHHPIGARRITAIRLISPKTYQPIASLTYLQEQHLLSTKPGEEWLLELTLDGGRRKKSKDLRPDLPLVIRY